MYWEIQWKHEKKNLFNSIISSIYHDYINYCYDIDKMISWLDWSTSSRKQEHANSTETERLYLLYYDKMKDMMFFIKCIMLYIIYYFMNDRLDHWRSLSISIFIPSSCYFCWRHWHLFLFLFDIARIILTDVIGVFFFFFSTLHGLLLLWLLILLLLILLDLMLSLVLFLILSLSRSAHWTSVSSCNYIYIVIIFMKTKYCPSYCNILLHTMFYFR